MSEYNESIMSYKEICELVADLRAENQRLRERINEHHRMFELLHAEIARLQQLLRETGANRYWEGRWRDIDKENEWLRAELERYREVAIMQDAKDEIERLRAQLVSDIHAETEIDRLETENARLRAALQFYATEENYLQSGWQGDPEPEKVLKDGGKRARRELEGGK